MFQKLSVDSMHVDLICQERFESVKGYYACREASGAGYLCLVGFHFWPATSSFYDYAVAVVVDLEFPLYCR